MSHDPDSELTTRLRSMSWPAPSDELRQRCLNRILEEISERHGELGGNGNGSGRFEREDRYECSRRVADPRVPPALALRPRIA